MARCATLCDKVCQCLATGRLFSPGTLISSTNKTDCHDLTAISLKVALNTIKETKINTDLTDMKWTAKIRSHFTSHSLIIQVVIKADYMYRR